MNDMHIAKYWKDDIDNAVRCGLCPHRCLIRDNAFGLCGARKNNDGILLAATYGHISSIALDPIEKKPLSMFNPGKNILSIGSFGCNLNCGFCQNFEISKEYSDILFEAKKMMPNEIVSIAIDTMRRNNIGVAFTYNEPLVGYEFVRDCAVLTRDAGLLNVLVTNGFINPDPLADLLPVIDAMNIDLKGFTKDFYSSVGGVFEDVKETIVMSAKQCHVEVTTLVIPNENENDIEDIAKWLSSINDGIPLHLTRFYPRYRYAGKSPTSREKMIRLSGIAKKYLKNVIVGNM